MLCTQPFSHSSLPAGFHWPRAVSVMFEVNIAVHIHNWEHVMVFGEDDPSRARIAVWKSDAETHFEPLVPMQCKRWRGRPLPQLTHFADVSDPSARLTLRQLTLHPDWISVQSAVCPPSPPRSPSPAGTSPHVVLVSDDEELVTSPSNTRRRSKRLSTRPTRVGCASDGEEHPGVDGSPVDGDELDEVPLTTDTAPTSSCVHKGRVRRTARMQCTKDSRSTDSDPTTSSCVHKAAGRASGRVRKTAIMECEKSSTSSVSDDDDDDIPLATHPLRLGFMLKAPAYVRGISPQAKDWLLHAFSHHHGGHVVCANSRLDYIYAKCYKCEAKAAVTLKPPFIDEKWFVTTVKQGADAACRSDLTVKEGACRSDLPPPPPPPPDRPASPLQEEVTCGICCDDTSSYITCACASVVPHVVCWTCMDASIAQQCQMAVVHFFRNRGITCPLCPAGANTTWRLSFQDVKHKLSAAR